MQKAELELLGGRDPDKIAPDETAVKVNAEQYWLVAAAEPDTNVIPHVNLYPSSNTALTKMFLRELRDKHAIDD